MGEEQFLRKADFTMAPNDPYLILFMLCIIPPLECELASDLLTISRR